MIPYHGLPIWPAEVAAATLDGAHAFVSAHRPEQLLLAVEVARSFAIDNGAFSAWKSGKPVRDWGQFYEWAAHASRFPSCDFVVIPDVIEGTEAENDALIDAWPLGGTVGAPVWHMHESLDRLSRLASEWPRVCLGSSGEFSRVGSAAWWARMRLAMLTVCDPSGRPITKLHGLRMLDPKVFSKLPLHSADSTNIARNIGIDCRWTGSYPPVNKTARALVIKGRIEKINGAAFWDFAQ